MCDGMDFLLSSPAKGPPDRPANPMVSILGAPKTGPRISENANVRFLYGLWFAGGAWAMVLTWGCASVLSIFPMLFGDLLEVTFLSGCNVPVALPL